MILLGDVDAAVAGGGLRACRRRASLHGGGAGAGGPGGPQGAGLSVDDIDVIEVNEAFAAQALAVMRDLKLPEDKTNPNGSRGVARTSHRRNWLHLDGQGAVRAPSHPGPLRPRDHVHRGRAGHRRDLRAGAPRGLAVGQGAPSATRPVAQCAADSGRRGHGCRDRRLEEALGLWQGGQLRVPAGAADTGVGQVLDHAADHGIG